MTTIQIPQFNIGDVVKIVNNKFHLDDVNSSSCGVAKDQIAIVKQIDGEYIRVKWLNSALSGFDKSPWYPRRFKLYKTADEINNNSTELEKWLYLLN